MVLTELLIENEWKISVKWRESRNNRWKNAFDNYANLLCPVAPKKKIFLCVFLSSFLISQSRASHEMRDDHHP